VAEISDAGWQRIPFKVTRCVSNINILRIRRVAAPSRLRVALSWRCVLELLAAEGRLIESRSDDNKRKVKWKSKQQ